MSGINRVALFGKLNSLGYKAIESATVFCKMRGNPHVELVHWFNQILQQQDSDLHRIIRHFELEAPRVAQDLTTALDKLPRGATSISNLSPYIEEAVERGWVYGTLAFGETQVRTGHLVVGLLGTKGLEQVLLNISKEFGKIKLEQLQDAFASIVSGSPEEHLMATDGFSAAMPGEASDAMAPAQMGKQEALKQFTVDLTEQARNGEMDPIVGRDEEIRQIVDILMRRRQNNPMLTGEAGVGKTAVVEGFAQKIASGDVPPPLQDVSLLSLDIGLLQAGASMKGEFENRLRKVIDEVQASEKPIILFIDEAHTLVGAGGAAGTGDAANLLKPALARGKLRTVAATTWAEYKKHIEKDPALTRRFQVVQVDEPDEEKAIKMMRNMAAVMENHHKVQLLDEAIESSVKLSHRYIPARQLPDKSVSLLDTACARVAISQHAIPAEVDDRKKLIDALNTELGMIEKETNLGIDTTARKAIVIEKLADEKVVLEELESRWKTELDLVTQILDLRKKLRSDRPEGETAETVDEVGNVSTEELLSQLKELQNTLHEKQGEDPLILPTVDAQAVASVVGDWTGIPVGRMVKNEIETVLHLADA